MKLSGHRGTEVLRVSLPLLRNLDSVGSWSQRPTGSGEGQSLCKKKQSHLSPLLSQQLNWAIPLSDRSETKNGHWRLFSVLVGMEPTSGDKSTLPTVI